MGQGTDDKLNTRPSRLDEPLRPDSPRYRFLEESLHDELQESREQLARAWRAAAQHAESRGHE